MPVLPVVVAAIPVVVMPGVLSTFEPIRPTLTGALGLFAVALAVAAHLSTGLRSFAAIGDSFVGARTVRGVRGVGT